jgi:hypothetical protein
LGFKPTIDHPALSKSETSIEKGGQGVSSRQFCASCLPCQVWEQSEILLGRIQFLFNQLHQDCLIGKVSQCNLTKEFAPVQ